MLAQLRIVNGIRHTELKELGRRTRRSYPLEQTPPDQTGSREELGNGRKNIVEHFLLFGEVNNDCNAGNSIF